MLNSLGAYLSWLVIETYVSKLSISFYRNIVCKNILPLGIYNLASAHFLIFST